MQESDKIYSKEGFIAKILMVIVIVVFGTLKRLKELKHFYVSGVYELFCGWRARVNAEM